MFNNVIWWSFVDKLAQEFRKFNNDECASIVSKDWKNDFQLINLPHPQIGGKRKEMFIIFIDLERKVKFLTIQLWAAAFICVLSNESELKSIES